MIKHSHRSPHLFALMTVVFSLGGLVLAAATFAWRDQDSLLLAALAGLTVAAEFFDFKPFRNSNVSLTIGLLVAAGTFSGLPGIAIVAATAAGTDYALRSRWYDRTAVSPITKATFNLCVLLIAGASLTGVLEVFGSTQEAGDWSTLIVPVLLGCVAAFVVDLGLVAMAICFETGIDLTKILRQIGRWTLPHFMILGQVALVAAAAYDRWEILGLVVVLVPLGLISLAIKQGMEGVMARSSAGQAS